MENNIKKLQLQARISLLENKGTSPKIVAKLKRKLKNL
ncbi:hypothetical protein HMPREF1092_00536 [Clostridium thermobutyricum]|uniref:Uncharacterized protein n=1 Tax=Clostridium thermobutyricum TaxID=29372 RepID=N9WKE9_9CLOT|nr:hypothetical protein HMPREF1092_00536 [Clostridium thermobutyricum]